MSTSSSCKRFIEEGYFFFFSHQSILLIPKTGENNYGPMPKDKPFLELQTNGYMRYIVGPFDLSNREN
jgi:hypothetical protein